MSSRFDLPLDMDLSVRFVPWVVALSMFVATVILLGTFTLSVVISHWESALAGKFTIEIPPYEKTPDTALKEGEKLKAVIDILRNTPGVAQSNFIPPEKMLRLLEPWLGAGNMAQDLPLPQIIEVDLREDAYINWSHLTEELQKIIPDLRIENHAKWREDFDRVVSVIQLIAQLIVFLVIFAAIATVAFTTYTGVIIHRDILSILRLIGARDLYIARQFQAHTLRLAVRGILVNLIFLVLVLLVTRWTLSETALYIPLQSLSLGKIAATILLVPLFVLACMVITSRATVMYALRHTEK